MSGGLLRRGRKGGPHSEAIGPGTALVLTVSSGTAAACGVGMLLAGAIGALGDGRELASVLLPGASGLTLGLLGLWLLLEMELPSRSHVPTIAGLGSITLAWSAATVIGAIPLVVSGVLPSLIDACFEAMSGFSTTGATLIDDVDATPDALLAWRSIMQWLGGVGIVVVIVAVAPSVAPGLQRFFYAEASGFGDGRLTPRIADTAKVVGGIYLTLSAAAMVAYAVAGMSIFDALNHAMATIATGGFSTHTTSLAAFDSLEIEIVATVFMIAAGVNFALYWRVIRGGTLMPQLSEVRIYLAVIVFASAAIAASLLITDEVVGVGEAIRQATFSVASISSTTGFTTADFDTWGGFAETSLLVLMVIGACTGSTAGGMKVLRVSLLARSAVQELQRQTEPRRITVLRMGGRVFSEGARSAVLGFFVIYVVVFTVGVIGFTASGLGEASAIGGVAATLNNIGPGVGHLGALENYSALADGGRVLAIFLMLAGRLEIFTVIALLAAGVGATRRRLSALA